MLDCQRSGAIIISVVTVLGFAIVCGLTFFMPRLDNQLTTVMLTTYSAGFIAVLNYWLGSSAGSKAKDQQIASLSQSLTAQPAERTNQ
jgi:DNA mismatch repair protein MutH